MSANLVHGGNLAISFCAGQKYFKKNFVVSCLQWNQGTCHRVPSSLFNYSLNPGVISIIYFRHPLSCVFLGKFRVPNKIIGDSYAIVSVGYEDERDIFTNCNNFSL